MCDPQHEERDWRFYVQDMLEFCERVLDYTSGLDQDSFTANRLPYDATLRNIQLIGEAATRIPAEVQENYPAIPWRSIIGVRNRLAHSYLHISDMVIWSIIQDAIPKLLPQLRRLLESSQQGPQ